MFGPAVLIAIEKSATSVDLRALEALSSVAIEYDRAELEFPRLLAEHKAQRGTKPPKLSKATRASLVNFEADQQALLATLREQYSSYLTPTEIVSSLATALENDIPRSASLVKCAPPEDQPIVEARVESKRALLKALQACLLVLRGESAA